jgi:hypothetical protein
MNSAKPDFSTVPGPASGPQPVGGPVAGIHTAAPARGLPGAIRAGAGAGILFWFGACTVATGNRNAGTFTYASLAGDAKFGEFGPEGMRNADINNSNGATIAKDSIEAIGRAYAWGKAWDAAGNLIDEGFDALKDGNSTDEAINANNNATKAEINTFVPPAQVVIPP